MPSLLPRWTIAALVIVLLIIGVAYLLRDRITQQAFAPTQISDLAEPAAAPGDKTSPTPLSLATFASNLDIPWEIAWLPNGDMLVTERPGQLIKIDSAGNRQPLTFSDSVSHAGEGGLLGLAVHPNFANNNFIYLYMTSPSNDGLINRVVRYKLIDDQLQNPTPIITDIPGARFHDGGRIAFGPTSAKASAGKPDYHLYITTGDAGDEDNAQDLDSLAGKILRLNDNGSFPADNPYNSAVYSYGHRNSQGLAWDDAGRLWATEHGRSGLRSGLDEVNLITPGQNYGWPTIQGDERKLGLVSPVINSGPDETWAPAGLAYFNGSLFFAGLRGETLYQAIINPDNSLSLTRHLREKLGRLRAVALGPDNMLYITTSNTDGRGNVQSNDDKIIRLDPNQFFSN